jgi:microcystin degradation protein MlrC
MTHHLAVARLFVASNSFAPGTADRAAFAAGEWVTGDSALAGQEGADSELGAVLDLVREKPDWRVTALRCAATALEAALDDDVFVDFCSEVLTGLEARRWDAVYLSLHGAAVTTRRLRPELSLISAVRAAIGEAALGVSFDLRANLAPETARYLSYAAAGRSGTPADRKATAARVVRRLAETAEGRLHPVGAVAKAFTMLPDRAADDAAFGDIQALARTLEAGPVLDVSVLPGFPYADTPDAGASAMAFAADGDHMAARRAAVTAAGAINQRRQALWAGADPALFALTYRKVPADLRPAT